MPTVAADALQAFTAAALQAGGAGDAAAEVVAEELISADLRGHDSHGVAHLPHYLATIASGRLDPRVESTLERRSGAVAVLDVAWGFGFVAARRGVTLAIEIARENGLACVALQRCSHVGRLGSYPERIARQGLVGIAMSSGTGSSGPMVAPHGGRTPLFGTNPLAVAIPSQTDDPIVVDFATAAVAGGKIAMAHRRGEALPEGAILAPDGAASTDPADLFAGGAQLPFGGHKGYALGLTIEILANLLTSFPPSSSRHWQRPGNPTLIAALDPASFVERPWFDEMVTELRANVETAVPASDGGTVRLPGARGFRSERERHRSGVPLDQETWNELAAVAQRHDLTLPALMQETP